MKEYLALTPDQHQRVLGVLQNDKPITTLQSPEEIHCAALNWNWDDGVKQLQDIVELKGCSLATALLIYWQSEPTEIFSCATAEEAEEKYYAGATFKLLIFIESQVLKNAFETFQISFDPQNHQGINLMGNWNHSSIVHSIPIQMTQKIEGMKINPQLLF